MNTPPTTLPGVHDDRVIGAISWSSSKGSGFFEYGTCARCAMLNRLALAGEDAAQFSWQALNPTPALHTR